MKVIVYSTLDCPWCDKLKEFLKSYKVKFKEFDVADDKEKASEMIEKSGETGVPQTEIIDDNGKSEIVIGFDEQRLRRLLNLK